MGSTPEKKVGALITMTLGTEPIFRHLKLNTKDYVSSNTKNNNDFGGISMVPN